MKKYLSFLILVAVTISLSSCGYNSMVSKREAVNRQWANVQSAYQRRADLIPNLVNTVKGSANFEQSTLTKVVEARSKATSINFSADELTSENIKKFQDAQSELSGALSRLLVVSEQYPDLKASQSFLELQAQLEGTENRINTERNKFNEAVSDYNSYIAQFPNLLYSGSFGFQKKGYFEAEKGSEKAPEVKF